MVIIKFLKYPIRYIIEPKFRFAVHNKLGFYRNTSDEKFLKKLFNINMGKNLDLEDPKTFNEKLQWLKLYDRNPFYTQLVDKYEVRKYISEKISDEYLIPLIGVWDKFEDIDFNSLPTQFVLKCTHDSGGIVICRDKSNFNRIAAQKKINTCLKKNYFYHGREWPYKNVPRKIIAEKYMVDESGIELKDYKFFCFNGVPKLIQVDFDRFYSHKRNIYSTDWQYLDVKIQYQNDPDKKLQKPQKLDEMLLIANILSLNIPHVRIDLYNISNKIYFGEMTFYHGSGFELINPESFGELMGDWLSLPNEL